MPSAPNSRGGCCPACGAELRPWRHVPSSEPAMNDVRYTLARCARCGTAVTLEPAPPLVHDGGAYGGGRPRLHGLAVPLLRRFDARRLAMLREARPPPARLLDVGAGRGRFVASARSAGYEASGIEPSQRGAEAAALLGVPVDRTSVEAAVLESGSFDVITLWHVLEHLDDPAGALTHIARWLAPGGVVLLGVPNLESFQARLSGPRWYHLDVPRHRTHFTQAGLRALLEHGGFELLATHHVMAEHNPFGMWQSWINRLTRTPSFFYNLLKRNAPRDVRDLVVSTASLPLVPLAALTELLAGLSGHGGTIAVLARSAGRVP